MLTFDPPSARRRDGAEGVAKERRRLVCGVGPSVGVGGGRGEEPLPLPLSLTRAAVCQLSEDVDESVEDVEPKAPVDFLFVPR